MFNIIYKTTNLINGKIYVGKHCQEICPVAFDGYLGSGLLISRAIKKYGKEKFERITLESFSTEKEAIQREDFWIDKFKSYDKNIGYNISKGGFGVSSEFMIEKWKEPGYRDRLLEIFNGEKYKNDISIRQTKKWENKDYRDFHSEINREIANRTEVKEKNSETMYSFWEDSVYREKQTKSIQIGALDPEYREYRRKIKTEHWKNPEYREKTSQAIKTSHNTPEFIKRQSENHLFYDYVFRDPEWKLWETNNVMEFSKIHNLGSDTMYKIIAGTRKQYKGWYFVSKTLKDLKIIK